MLFIASLTTQSSFLQPLAGQGRSEVLEGNSLDHIHYAWKVLEATAAAAAEIVAEVANIVGAAEVALVADKAVGIEVGVVDAVGRAENTTLGSRVEEQKAQSKIAGDQREKPGFAVEEERIVEVVASMIVVVANEECWGLVGGAGIESIVVGKQRREEPAEGTAVGHIADVG